MKSGFASKLRGICLLVLPLAFLTACTEGQSTTTSPTVKQEAGSEPAKAREQVTGPHLKFSLAPDAPAKDGFWKSTPVFHDINRDGHVDIGVASRAEKGAQVWLGDGTGRWRDYSEGLGPRQPCGGGIDFGDINKDGITDAAVADHCQGVFVYLGSAQGRWVPAGDALVSGAARKEMETREDSSLLAGAEDLAMGDVNEDGFLDLVFAASDQGGFSVFLGDGSGKSWKEMLGDGLPSVDDPEPEDENRAGWANQVLLHDMNGDGHLDVVASYYAGPRVWLGDGKAGWKPASEGLPSPMMGGLFRGIAVGDVNEDGRTDLAVANDFNGAEIFLQQSDGKWRQAPDVIPSMKGGASGVVLVDMDLDGHLDVIAAGRRARQAGFAYGLFASKGDGKGQWTQQDEIGLPQHGMAPPWGVAVADVNGDKLPDLAVATGGEPVRVSRQKPQAQLAQAAAAPDAPSFPRMQVWINRKP